MVVGLASAIGIGLPRRLVSSVAARSSRSSSWSSRYRMAFGKSLGRAVLREGRPARASGELLDGEVQSPGRKQVGRLVLSGIAAHAEDIAALGIVRQSQIWRLEPSDVYIISINASANLMAIRRSIPQNTILISRQASSSISRSLRGS